MIDFGRKLKELRIKNNQSQKDLAEYLNISFQSISKWEQGVHYPDVFTLNKLAEFYNIGVNYFFGEQKKDKEINAERFNVSINKNSSLSVWTDFIYNDKIAPISLLDPKRHRSGNGELMTHPGPKESIILAVNKDNKICFLGEHVNNWVPSCGPQGFFYHMLNEGGKNNPCFIFEETYKEKTSRIDKETHEKDFEFVIPKGGFLITFSKFTIEAKKLLIFILPKTQRRFVERHYPVLKNQFNGKSLFNYMLLQDELNHCNVFLRGNELIIEKEIEILENTNFTNESELIKELKETIDVLEERVEELQLKIHSLEDMIEDVESRVDDLDCKIDELE